MEGNHTSVGMGQQGNIAEVECQQEGTGRYGGK